MAVAVTVAIRSSLIGWRFQNAAKLLARLNHRMLRQANVRIVMVTASAIAQLAYERVMNAMLSCDQKASLGAICSRVVTARGVVIVKGKVEMENDWK